MTIAIASDLIATLEREEFREALERLCVSGWHSGAIQETRIQPIRSRPNRCTVAIVVNARTGQHELIGKIYADDRADVFDTMRRLSRDGFGTESDNSVPTPFGWLPALRVRLEEKIAGSSMNDVIRTGRSADWTVAAERCGEWLGRFHRAAPRPERGYDLAAKLAHHRQATARMARLRQKAEALLAQLEEAVALAPVVVACAGHGRYIPDHVLFSGRRTVVIDLDEHDAADPSRDVAGFLVVLQRRAIQLLCDRHALDSVPDAFVAAYTASGPPGALANLRLYRALACLSWARRDLDKQTPELAEFMVDEALRLMSH